MTGAGNNPSVPIRHDYTVTDGSGYVYDRCPSYESALRTVDVLEETDRIEGTYEIGRYHIILPHGLDSRIWTLPPLTVI